MSWENLKKRGNDSYKSETLGGVELLDLFKDSHVLRTFAICSAMKYLWRNRNGNIKVGDMEKAKHYIDMLIELAKKEDKNESNL